MEAVFSGTIITFAFQNKTESIIRENAIYLSSLKPGKFERWMGPLFFLSEVLFLTIIILRKWLPY